MSEAIDPWPFSGIALAVLFFSGSAVFGSENWQTLFNGKDLTGWRANVTPEAFTVTNGMIRANPIRESAHLFYVGNLKDGFVRFKNFELEATVRGETNSNSGIFIHTDM